jgi:hypothetical protein
VTYFTREFIDYLTRLASNNNRDWFQAHKRVALHDARPKEFASEVERYPLIANKQFYYFAEYGDPCMVMRRDLADVVMRHYEAGLEVNGFLARALP